MEGTGFIDYAMLGRKLMRDNPATALSYQSEINECRQTSLTDTSLINRFFVLFCHHQNLNIDSIRYNNSRTTQKNVDSRRLFIAVIMQMYDTLNIEGYTLKKMDRVRLKLSDVLNCHPVWISRTWPSILHDIEKLKGYQNETKAIIAFLKDNIDIPLIIPEFTNTKRTQQFELFG